ncbi:MAG: hypothetical protein JOY80_10955 [Candidatus Dormibacteraeota bacterium]|nr:hypothetical protein [Candidatus Dormibacteraeota bacterium]
MLLRLSGFVLALLVGGAVSACAAGGTVARHDAPGSAPAPERLEQSIQLSSAQVRAGEAISAALVITNPGTAVDLGGHGCRPRFVIVLTDGRHPLHLAWLQSCASGSLVIPHGTTRLPAFVSTSQPACEPGGPAYGLPGCIGSSSPPLPVGRYEAVLVWERDVPLPPAQPVPVNLVAS